MKRYVQHEPFNVYLFTVSQWPHPVHKHSYFEIIVIRSGCGRHFINGNTVEYATGDVFLLGPEDYHSFEIEEPTTFCYLRFTEVYLKRGPVSPASPERVPFEFLLHTPFQASGSVVTDPVEKALLNHLLIVLLHEYHPDEGSDELLINSLMKSILAILARNVVRHQASTALEKARPKVMESLLLYICQHIHEPDALRLEKLVERFPFSPGYLSALFKTYTGESLQRYILKYRLRMIENRLRFSTRSIAEITDEFGFTDSSHLAKLFKKYYGQSPQGFRKAGLPQEVQDGLA